MSEPATNRELEARFSAHERFDDDRFIGLRADIRELKVQIATSASLARDDTAAIRLIILGSAGAIILFLLGLTVTLALRGH